jgi:nucleoside phosphorylase/tetratricopeptide (TPR) repeat protein
MSPARKLPKLDCASLRGEIDVAIITIREDEEQAVLKRFTPAAYCEEVPCSVSYVRVEGGYYAVAVTRCLWQGTNEAQKVTETLILKLAPKWIIAVGIAGAVPDNEFSLGDVVLANQVYDLNTSATKEGDLTYSLRGGDVHELAARLLGGLGSRQKELGGWNTKASLKAVPPALDLSFARCYGDDSFQADVLQTLRTNFANGPRRPRVTVRPIVSSSQLVQDTERVKVWKETMRHFAAIEMEFAGVYRAAKGRGPIDGTDLPVLTVRGISDVVGLRREGVGDWTTYACNTAAALTKALVSTAFFGEPRPGEPPHRSSPSKARRTRSTDRVSVLPDVGTLPVWDEKATLRREFVGRQDILEGFREAVHGLGRRSKTRFGGVRLFWIHGFGGMGKSWLLRRFCDEAREAKSLQSVGFIDWQLPEWHQPADCPPLQAVEVFDAIAYRVAQLYGPERLSPYWTARRDVERAAQSRSSFVTSLQDALDRLGSLGPNWRQSLTSLHNAHGGVLAEVEKPIAQLEILLRRLGIWTDDPKAFSLRVRESKRQLPFERIERDLTTAWVRDIDSAAPPEVAGPSRYLADKLRVSLRKAAAIKPLILILDTCELLHDQTDSLDEWLRGLFAPLINDQTPLLLAIGGRFAPDHALSIASRGGWRNEIDARRYEFVPLENHPFTYGEIKQRLKLSGDVRPLPENPELTELFMQVTLGLPLAVGILLDLHSKGEPVLADLPELNAGASDELDREVAVQLVYERVASRFLLHLEARLDRADDLRDITALAILRRASVELLGQFWSTNEPKSRLLQLSRQYELMANGDLHQRVREFLRRHWRNSPPDGLRGIANKLLAALDQIQPGGTAEDERYVTWLLERLSLLGWLRGEDAYPDIIRSLAVFLAHGTDTRELISLAREIQPQTRKGRELRSRLVRDADDWSPWSLQSGPVNWLRQQVTSQWSEEEFACVRLLAARSMADQKEWIHACAEFEGVFELVGTALPRPEDTAQRYFACVSKLGQSAVLHATRACTWAQQLDLVPKNWDLGYYWVLHNARRYEEAVRFCKSCLVSSPDERLACKFLGHTLAAHLGKTAEAERVLRDELSRTPDDPNISFTLAETLAQKPGGLSEAATLFERCSQPLLPPPFRAQALLAYAQCLSETDARKVELYEQALKLAPDDPANLSNLARSLPKDDARKATLYEQALKRTPDNPNTLNGAAWSLYVRHDNLERAAAYAQRALELEKDSDRLQTFAAVLVRQGKCEEALPYVKEWVDGVATQLQEGWHDFVLLFQDALEQGKAELLGDTLSTRCEPDCVALRAALRAAGGNRAELETLPPELASLALRLLPQLSPGTKVTAWPS